MIDDKLLPFALIVATVVGTAIAVLIGRALDAPAKKAKRVLALSYSKEANVIDLSEKGILLSPKVAERPFERVYEQILKVANIGFDRIDDIRVKVETNYDGPFDADAHFFDKAASTDPDGIKFSFETGHNGIRDTSYFLVIPFLNRGDTIEVRTLASSKNRITASAHLPSVEVRRVSLISPLPTTRESLVRLLAKGRFIETVGGGIAAAASVAAITQLLG